MSPNFRSEVTSPSRTLNEGALRKTFDSVPTNMGSEGCLQPLSPHASEVNSLLGMYQPLVLGFLDEYLLHHAYNFM